MTKRPTTHIKATTLSAMRPQTTTPMFLVTVKNKKMSLIYPPSRSAISAGVPVPTTGRQAVVVTLNLNGTSMERTTILPPGEPCYAGSAPLKLPSIKKA